MQRNSLARAPEIVETAAILGNIRVADIDDRIEQRHGLGQHGGLILSALGGEFAQPRVGGERDAAADEAGAELCRGEAVGRVSRRRNPPC